MSPRPRRTVRTGSLLGILLMLVVAMSVPPVVPDAHAAGVDLPSGRSSPTAVGAAAGSAAAGSVTCSAPSGRVAVGVVVVFSDGSAPVIRCTDQPNTANGFDALRDTGFTARVEKGFLCGIDGIPASGCATGGGFDGQYWRYFRGDASGRWKYASVGAGSRLERHDGCATEGWVWSGRPEVTPPSVLPAQIGCTHHTPTTRPATTTTERPAAPTTRAPGGGQAGTPTPGGSPVGGAPPGGGASSGGSDDRGAQGPVGGIGDGAGSTTDASSVGSGSVPGGEDGGSGEWTDPDGDADGTDGVDTQDDGSTSAGDEGVGGGSTDEASEAVGDESTVGAELGGAGTVAATGSPIGTVVTGLVVAALVVGAVVVGRRRSTESRTDP